MASRARGLGTFYDSALWKSLRDEANASFTDTDNVLLLRPASATGSIDLRGLPRKPEDGIEVALLQGAAHRGMRQAQRAVAVYRAAIATNPGALSVRTELAATLFSLGRTDEAQALLTAVLTDDPNYTRALLLRGGLEAMAGRTSAAEATLQKVVEGERASPTPTQRYPAALAQLVEVQMALGKSDAAAANADTLFKLNEHNPIARYIKALLLVQQGDLDGAQQRLEALVAEVPNYWAAHRLLGAVHARRGNIGQAQMYLRTAVNNNPGDSTARLQLAELYIGQGDIDGARTLLEGSAAAANDELFFAFAGRASQRAGLPDQANDLFNRSEQRTPANLQELVGLSNMYMAAGEFERAIRLLQSSNLKDQQSQQTADYLLAMINIRQGNTAEADEAAQRLAQQQPKAAWPLNLRGLIALRRADVALATSFFKQALEREPQNMAATLNLARVAVFVIHGNHHRLQRGCQRDFPVAVDHVHRPR